MQIFWVNKLVGANFYAFLQFFYQHIIGIFDNDDNCSLPLSGQDDPQSSRGRFGVGGVGE